ncbi:S9 family peptidase [Luteitalea sp.]|uniref:S9 family peptidase n=1 Tax=Luteitalea sp. TaxID=2004800 RepID=UPI0025C6FF6E|nr:S9 family peptidase [Luteitalea sp.]
MTSSLLVRRPWLAGVLLLVTTAPLAAQVTSPTTPAAGAAAQPAAAPRPIVVADVDRIISVRDPQRSPDGAWVAYAASTVDVAKDKSDTDIWMVKWDGSDRIRLTSTPDAESAARWSPDGKWLSFLRADEKKKSQVWTLSRLGGEAQKLTDVAGGVSGYAWSPDSARLVVTSRDVDPTADDDKPDKAPKPIEIETFKFKRDGVGYVDGKLRTHLYLYDIAAKRTTPLTSGPYDDSAPTWSPDGRHIAFISARSEARERSSLREVYVIESRAGATPRQVSTNTARHSEPLAWSPDSATLLFMEGGDPRYDAYEQYRMAIVPVAGGRPTLLTPSLDRPVSDAVWSRDGSRITFVVTDDREQYVASVAARGGAITRITSGQQVVRSLADSPADDHLAVTVSSARQPDEIYALDGGTLRKLTGHNDWMAKELTLGTVKPVEFTNKEGVRIGALLTLPPAVTTANRLPFILHIHGGPNGQDSYGFNVDREWIAANGYAVLQVNYRGSHGRGQAFQSAIFGDWGNKEVADLLAGVDWAIKEGIADPARLGIGGWSYGGILTNYTIASDPRFKGAVSGAGSSLQLTMYGTDQYIVQYETEMGQPWKTMDRWMKVSYPFFKIDQIKTPTMFMAGEKDFNVPAIGSEQMYQGLKSVGTTTRLIIYPGQFHGITRPSYRRHRLEQWVGWFDTHVKGGVSPAPRPVTATAAEGQR